MRLALAFVLCLTAPATAQSFDCAKAESSAEKLVCSDARLGALDDRVAARYAAALSAAESLDAGAEDAVAELKAVQRGWIGGRDECWKTENVAACVEQSYLRREAELVATWMLEQPTNTAVWACDGNPANEVVTMFFDTELPSLRFERGDSIDVGTLTPAASGSRYMGSFGREIWIKGEEASYREPDPEGTEMSCILQN
ncbi:MliC family protein [Vannielia litorea]|uniref:MliC family protein n=1 Tax=Vannielia litorea TaxID=1217970 RepID=UPI001FD5682E|nr:MliC family protein [Vannielia litorea]